MTTRKQFVVARGGKLEVGLPVTSAAQRRSSDQLIDKDHPHKNVIPTEELDDLYVFRKNGITFYDLGTRLRSIVPASFDRLRRVERTDVIETDPHDGYFNEYVELDLEKGKNINSFGLTISEIAGIEAELLRGDYLGTSVANIPSGATDIVPRKLPNCAQLQYESEWLYVDAILSNEDGSTRYALTQPNKRAYTNDVYNGSTVKTDAWINSNLDPITLQPVLDVSVKEVWNPLNLSVNAVGHDGILKAPSNGSYLSVESIAFFEALDTGDTARFKWTNEPSYSSPEVGAFVLGNTARVFLRPRIHHTSFGYVFVMSAHSSTPGQAQVLTRLPFYPLTGKLIRSIPLAGGVGSRMIITRGFARGMSASLERSTILRTDRDVEENSDLAIFGDTFVRRRRGNCSYMGGAGFSGHNQPLIEGMLIGIVETKDQVFYGWSKQVVDTTARTVFIFGDSSVSLIAGASLPISYWQCPPYILYTGSDNEVTSSDNPGDVYQS